MEKMVDVNGFVRNLYGLDRDEIWKLIQAGAITFDQFDDWLDEFRSDAYNAGYDSGYDSGYDTGHDTGYESAQENYGDGPSQ